jgi:sec-independent protein translocase protein TatA
MPSVGVPELLIVLLIVLLVFGGAKLPKLARALGQAKSEFEKGVEEGHKSASGESAAAEKESGDS